MLSLFIANDGLLNSLLAVGNTLVGVVLMLVAFGYAYGQFTDSCFPVAGKFIGSLAVLIGVFFLGMGIWGLATFVVLMVLAMAIVIVGICVFFVSKKIVNYTMTICWYCFRFGEKISEWSS